MIRTLCQRRLGAARTRFLAAGLAAAVLLSLGLTGAERPAAPSADFGVALDRAVPDIPLLESDGRTVTLQSFRGRDVVLVPFLTLCQEVCPLDTGALQVMRADLAQAHLNGKVVLVEATVDPGRDSPARLRAYAATFGAPWTLLTGTKTHLQALWKFFGIYHQQVPEGKPAQIDWWTHKPLTYDVDHGDGFILLDTAGHERFVTTDTPNVGGKLPADLKALLDKQGVHNLEHPQVDANWTPQQALAALAWVMGRQIPGARY